MHYPQLFTWQQISWDIKNSRKTIALKKPLNKPNNMPFMITNGICIFMPLLNCSLKLPENKSILIPKIHTANGTMSYKPWHN